MKKSPIVYALLVVLLLSLGMVGCAKRAEPVKATPVAAPAASTPTLAKVDRTGWPVIVAFGDSLTAGQGVAVDFTYPSRLQAELDRRGYQYRVVNAGISGDTTGGGVNRVEAVLKHKPEIVILELGANDGLQGKSVEQMRANLSRMIERLQQEKTTVVLAGMQIPPNYGADYTTAFAGTFPELAQRYNLPFIPFFLDGVAAKPQLNQMDGIHPTGEGYKYVVENVLAVLEPLLKK